MWPFRKKVAPDRFDWESWCSKWPPGKEFEYMGIKFKVATNLEIMPWGSVPLITANYVHDGIIRSKEFMKAEMDRIE